jgi:hypothetical protein
MLKCFFLKKKRFLFKKSERFFQKFQTGTFISFEFLSLDFDSVHKYKFQGLCVGIKSSFSVSVCFLNSVIYSNYLKLVFFLLSPFLFNFKVIGLLRLNKAKAYKLVPRLRMFRQLL